MFFNSQNSLQTNEEDHKVNKRRISDNNDIDVNTTINTTPLLSRNLALTNPDVDANHDNTYGSE